MKLNQPMIDTLLESGNLKQCAACGELSADSWNLVTTRSQFRLDAKPGEIAHVGAASCWEWVCGHCRASNVNVDDPILAEVYTHRDYSQEVSP